MIKKLQKNDIYFVIAMIAALTMHLLCIYSVNHFADETFHPTVALRLINGDSLIQHEWHLTQFSSLFLYLPVRIWLALKGSTEGILLYLRYFYLVIHTVTAVGLYTYFRKYKTWAVVASLLFYTQVPLRFMNANYHSLLALFLLLLTITLVTICKNNNMFLYIFAGLAYGFCCVCNPFFCAVFVVYAIICIIWHQPKLEICNRFFGKQAFLRFSIGLAIAAVVSVGFFMATGGTILSLVENFKHLLTDSGHDIFMSPVNALLLKLQTTWSAFNNISFNMPFLLPALYIALFFDRNRRKLSHKVVYVSISFVIAVFYSFSIIFCTLQSMYTLAIGLPFAIISIVCYILTENKNKKLFCCMWLPGVLGTIIQYFASALLLSVFWVLTISNIAGVFFVKDFFAELTPQKVIRKKRNTKEKDKSLRIICKSALCIGICLQLIFHCAIYSIGRVVKFNEYSQIHEGPYAGYYMEEENLYRNLSMMNDLDIIKERSNPDDPVLILSEFSWMYLYIDRPFASYSAWQPHLEAERLKAYYEANPDKKPKYIYVGWVYIPIGVSAGHSLNQAQAQYNASILKEMFNCTQEELSHGIMLTVND